MSRRLLVSAARSTVPVELSSLLERYHRAFNDRDFDVWREVFDDDVELLIDGMSFRGVDAAVAYGVGSVSQFPGLYIAFERTVAESQNTIVSEIDLVSGDPASGHSRQQGTACEVVRVRDGRIVSCRSYYMPEPADRADVVRVPARAEASLVAQEQTALRRVATLVARGVSQEEVFAAVTEETSWLVSADTTSLLRFEPDDTITLVAAWSSRPADLPIGSSVPVDEQLRSIRETGRSWRRGPADLPPSGSFVEEARALGMRTFVGVPIVVDGRIWGVMFVSSTADQPFAEDVEARLAGFTELVATAIANAEARAALTASLARIVAAADATRRRFERDLHDTAQQRLVSLALHVQTMVRDVVPLGADELTAQLDRVADEIVGVVDELREMSRGLHPAALADGGLCQALKTLARRSAIPVRLDVRVDGRLPEPTELAAYYVVAEALTNTVKHANATVIDVQAAAGEGVLRLGVRDDGRGGADITGGSGLIGLTDRVEALGGRLTLDSPPGGGTDLQVVLPLPSDPGAAD
jgi:signal transduction histidine kinase/ketosteroid isomerase-like protein